MHGDLIIIYPKPYSIHLRGTLYDTCLPWLGRRGRIGAPWICGTCRVWGLELRVKDSGGSYEEFHGNNFEKSGKVGDSLPEVCGAVTQ